MVNLFGNKNALIGSLELFVAAILVLGAFIFRKSVANDMLDRPFCILSSSGAGILSFIITYNIFDKLKFPVLITLGVFLIVGFIVGDLLGAGYAEGGGQQNG